ncbi:DUF192 domain-containing protein [Idiomarina loihiensis]|uniref:DUF192 domain-containing protein n=1 Tax=Idiomarina loihiensis TaxID=135577 RepID=UPI00129CCBAC|nr:DUF192 domain-containing protein [Idiomarina loihiensis]MRJ43830.1 DUF192 domain-containing protein [Idiomarina loihiensis]UTW34036.1 DUF192 domain-containing protein [Idiomarina loihiensis]
MNYRVLFILISALPFCSLAQQWNVPEPQEFDKTEVCLGELEQPLTVELADNQQQQARGLMQRESLGEYNGMWFRYGNERPGYSGFWMYQTLIPLDIAYLDRQGRIVKTFTMRPCGSDDPTQCRSYSPGKNYWSVLEVNGGFFAEHDIRMGDQLRQTEGESCEQKYGKE